MRSAPGTTLKIAALTGALALVGLTAALAVAQPAEAHNYLVSSTPAEGETLTAVPEQFIVTTNDTLLDVGSDGGFGMQVTGPDGLYYGDGCVALDGPSVTMPATLGKPGDYSMVWQVVSTDGHTISGTIPFTWAPSDTSTIIVGTEAPPVCGETTTPDESVAPEAESSEPEASPYTDPLGETEGAEGDPLRDLLWIGGALVAVFAAVAVTLLVVRRSATSPGESPKESPGGEPTGRDTPEARDED